MPKMKTLCSASKRFKKTKFGNFKRKKTNLRHLLTKKTSSYKRHLRNKVLLSPFDKKRVISFFPYRI